jgi:hypothetical protein
MWSARRVVAVLVAAPFVAWSFVACSLNPQPLPPAQPDDAAGPPMNAGGDDGATSFGGSDAAGDAAYDTGETPGVDGGFDGSPGPDASADAAEAGDAGEAEAGDAAEESD